MDALAGLLVITGIVYAEIIKEYGFWTATAGMLGAFSTVAFVAKLVMAARPREKRNGQP